MRGEIFLCLRFERFSLFSLKKEDLEAAGNFYPPPCEIRLSLSYSSVNPYLHGLFSGFFVLTFIYEDIE